MTPKERRVQELLARPIIWPVPVEAVRMIALEEDCRLQAYQCSAGVWTCGWGETDGVVPGMVWTQDYADQRFRDALEVWGRGVSDMLKRPATDNQLAAMLCLAYNIGLAGFAKSTVLRQHNAGNHRAAARAFALWNKVRENGVLVENDGLTARRSREAAMYLKPAFEGGTVPQAVAEESSLARSPIAQSGAATAAAGGVTVATVVAEQVDELAGVLKPLTGMGNQLTETVQSFTGLPPAALAGVVLLGLGWAVMTWRRKQRSEGWA